MRKGIIAVGLTGPLVAAAVVGAAKLGRGPAPPRATGRRR